MNSETGREKTTKNGVMQKDLQCFSCQFVVVAVVVVVVVVVVVFM